MVTADLNHVSVVATDLDESAAFYADLFDAEPVPAPNFEVPVRWLSFGTHQLHLFQRDVDAPTYHHFGLTVDDFESVYRTAVDRDLLGDFADDSITGLYELPDGAVQLYLRDPDQNLVEVNWPDAATLPAEIRERIVDRDELIAQTGAASEATLGIGGD